MVIFSFLAWLIWLCAQVIRFIFELPIYFFVIWPIEGLFGMRRSRPAEIRIGISDNTPMVTKAKQGFADELGRQAARNVTRGGKSRKGG